jgi:hypothetical protein
VTSCTIAPTTASAAASDPASRAELPAGVSSTETRGTTDGRTASGRAATVASQVALGAPASAGRPAPPPADTSWYVAGDTWVTRPAAAQARAAS